MNGRAALDQSIRQEELINKQSTQIDKLEKQLLATEAQLNSLRGIVMARIGSGATA